MITVDGQVHLWASTRKRRQAKQHRDSFRPDELLREMDRASVDAAIVIPPSFNGYRNDLVLAAAAAHPGRLAAMGRVDLDDPSAGVRLVREWRAQPGALGFRLVLAPGSSNNRRRSGSALTDGRAEWFWGIAAECGVPVMTYCTGILDEIAAVADHYPELRLIIDHLGLPPVLMHDDLVAARVNELAPLADRPNVAVKVGPVPYYTLQDYPYPRFQTLLARVLAWFGPDRVFWSSDLTRLPGSYRQLVTFYQSELDFLSASDRETLLGAGLLDWLDWPNPLRASRR